MAHTFKLFALPLYKIGKGLMLGLGRHHYLRITATNQRQKQKPGQHPETASDMGRKHHLSIPCHPPPMAL
jgi:hypothetical protein